MILKEPSVHLPVLSLVSRTVGGLRRLEGILVDRLQGKVADDVFELAGLDIVLLDLWQRLTDVAGAEGSLVVGEVDEGELRRPLAFEGSIRDAEHDVLRFGRRGGRSCAQEGLDLL